MGVSSEAKVTQNQRAIEVKKLWAYAHFERMAREALSKAMTNIEENKAMLFDKQTLLQLHVQIVETMVELLQNAYKYTKRCRRKILTWEDLQLARDNMFKNLETIHHDNIRTNARYAYVKRVSLRAGVLAIQKMITPAISSIMMSILVKTLETCVLLVRNKNRVLIRPEDLTNSAERVGLKPLLYINENKPLPHPSPISSTNVPSYTQKEQYTFEIIQNANTTEIQTYFDQCWNKDENKSFDYNNTAKVGNEQLKTNSAFVSKNQNGDIAGVILYNDYKIDDGNKDYFIYYGTINNKNPTKIKINQIRELTYICTRDKHISNDIRGLDLIKRFEEITLEHKKKLILLDAIIPDKANGEQEDFYIHHKLFDFYKNTKKANFDLVTEAVLCDKDGERTDNDNSKQSPTHAFFLGKQNPNTNTLEFRICDKAGNIDTHDYYKDNKSRLNTLERNKVKLHQVSKNKINFEGNGSRVRFVKLL